MYEKVNVDVRDSPETVAETYDAMGNYLVASEKGAREAMPDASATTLKALGDLYAELRGELVKLAQKAASSATGRRRGRARRDAQEVAGLARLMKTQPWFFRTDDVPPPPPPPSPEGRQASWVDRQCLGAESGWRYFDALMTRCDSEFEKFIAMSDAGGIPFFSRDDVELLFRVCAVQHLQFVTELSEQFNGCARLAYRIVDDTFAPDFDQPNYLDITLESGKPEAFELVSQL